MVTTGDIHAPYQILRVVGAIVDDRDSVAGPKGCGGCGGATTVTVRVSPNDLFKRAEHALLAAAAEVGGNAVVGARFEHRVSAGIFGGSNQSVSYLELVASGTAVKLHS